MTPCVIEENSDEKRFSNAETDADIETECLVSGKRVVDGKVNHFTTFDMHK